MVRHPAIGWETARMATTEQTLREDLQGAIRARDEVRVATLRMVLAAVQKEQVAGDVARTLTDEELQGVLRREAKKRREAATAYDDVGRPDRADRERAELAVLDGYLPAQLSDEELTTLVTAAITETGAQGPRAMGQVMKAVQGSVAGRADGARVSSEVRRQLAG
jgi:uncharacterized protein YqeY